MSSVFFYYKDGKLYAGPAWDYDLSAGNINDTLLRRGFQQQKQVSLLGRPHIRDTDTRRGRRNDPFRRQHAYKLAQQLYESL